MVVEPDALNFRRVSIRVGKHDSLSSIAARNRVSVAQLRNWNNLHQDRLVIGQNLQIQVQYHAGGIRRVNRQIAYRTKHRVMLANHPARHGKIILASSKTTKKHPG
jgi:membrane-bound lytic murein transglycosylase D